MYNCRLVNISLKKENTFSSLTCDCKFSSSTSCQIRLHAPTNHPSKAAERHLLVKQSTTYPILKELLLL